MKLGWFPLKHIVSWAARRHGFIDPVMVLARLESFGQPAEVEQPIELLRAGLILHARGLVNARVIQHNLDWVWPYWVERQFDPRDCAFIPRSFSITHVNLTHRNWTALGLPGLDVYPLVDPRGLVTPLYDGWSIDGWLIRGDEGIIPSREAGCEQRLCPGDEWAVETRFEKGGLELRSTAVVEGEGADASLITVIEARGPADAELVVAIRPYNPEGISFIDQITVDSTGRVWTINDREEVRLDRAPDAIALSAYTEGDVYRKVRSHSSSESHDCVCSVGLASGAARYSLGSGSIVVSVRTPLGGPSPQGALQIGEWRGALGGATEVNLDDPRLNLIYAAAMRTLVLLSPGEIYPGPFTYRRFWFRDAAFMIHGLLSGGVVDAPERCIDRFIERQTDDGYLRSQEGEWDSNGAALWVIERYCALAHREPKREWLPMIRAAADWIGGKRLAEEGNGRAGGLLPAGFSAEHLGPNDFYFWDDFWGIAGLEAAAALFERVGRPAIASGYRAEAAAFRRAVHRAIAAAGESLGFAAIPASPYRRMDAGAIGSIVCAYPLDIIPAANPALTGTLEYLWRECSLDGAFFQDMIHSGLNPYLSLHLAQIFVRRNDPRAHTIFERIGALASPTGQWPEAIHPATGGGCMGDGHHGWAAAEWAAYVRGMFVREEGAGLLLCAGVPLTWLERPRTMWIGPVLTPF